MDFVKETIAKPLARRVGTFLAGMIGAVVILAPDQVNVITDVFTALALVGVDLVFSAAKRGR